ncbi:ribonuclease H-like domain-containing protein [Halovenus halobia]|uniref:ribonuclease H-like domain-containing protein n=1 Tax=Halovenus halobia TaxID=3396622 RepID=UPI003F57E750
MAGQLDLTVYADNALSRMTTEQLADSLAYFEPDVVVVPRPHHELELRQALDGDIQIIVTGRPPHTLQPVQTDSAVDLVHVPDAASLAGLSDLDATLAEGETYLLSDLLAVDIDLVNLETRLDGRETYEAALPEDLRGSYTHLTTEANPDYRGEWGDLVVHGAMPGANERQGQTEPGVAHLQLRADGVVCTETITPEKFGLRALDQVGRTRAETLREAGYRRREDVADGTIPDLADLDGFGRETAQTILESAAANAEGEVRRHGDDGFPSADPIFIDIETDGLNPTMVWLIGVLDDRTEEYRSFLARDPEEPGAAIEAFLSWLRTNATNRPVVAYNGRNFDFPVIEEHAAEHCPQYLDDWAQTWTFDPYFWATTEGQAILPGRTNKLEDVAATLGWEGADTGLSGAAVARLFQRYQANPHPETALDWDRHKRYCEDDVRALAHVYDALADATATQSSDSTATGANTAQGQLSDF